MRIGVDARTLYRRDMKGIGTYLQNLLPHLARLDPTHEYYLYFDTRQDTVSRVPVGTTFVERGVSVRTGDRFYLWEQIGLPRALRRDGIGLLHSPANTTCLFKGCPTIVSLHDTKIFDISKRHPVAYHFYVHRLQRFALRRAARIICPSAFTRRCVVETLGIPEERIVVIPLAVGETFQVLTDTSVVDSVRAQYGLRSGFILSVGGESALKNNSRLLKAFAVMKRRRKTDYQLVITGIRDRRLLERHMDEATREGIEQDVHILGYVPEAELVGLYNAAAAFVYPSLFEGFGFPPLEAMACGVPVAASNATSIPEVVGDAALLFDAYSITDMADRVETIVTDRELAADLRRRGLERVRRFDWGRTAQLTLDVYDEVMRFHDASSSRPRPLHA